MPLPTAPPPPPSPRPRRKRETPAAVAEEVAMPDLGATEASEPRTRSKRSRPVKESEQPVRKRRARAPKGDPIDRRQSQDDDVPEGWIRDRKTNVLHKYIPQTEMDEDNLPVLHLDDLNLDDLTGEAEKYLAHLRVPPDKEERERLMEEKAARARTQNRAYTKANPEEETETDGV